MLAGASTDRWNRKYLKRMKSKYNESVGQYLTKLTLLEKKRPRFWNVGWALRFDNVAVGDTRLPSILSLTSLSLEADIATVSPHTEAAFNYVSSPCHGWALRFNYDDDPSVSWLGSTI